MERFIKYIKSAVTFITTTILVLFSYHALSTHYLQLYFSTIDDYGKWVEAEVTAIEITPSLTDKLSGNNVSSDIITDKKSIDNIILFLSSVPFKSVTELDSYNSQYNSRGMSLTFYKSSQQLARIEISEDGSVLNNIDVQIYTPRNKNDTTVNLVNLIKDAECEVAYE